VTEEPLHDPRRGPMLLYAVSFALLVGAAIALTVSVVGFLESTSLLVLSTVLSGSALVLAIVGLVRPRHR